LREASRGRPAQELLEAHHVAMTDIQPSSVETLFHEALKRTGQAEREAYLDGACRGDASLRTRVDALLAAHAEADGFLEPPTRDEQGKPLAEGPGTRIGPYKLLQKIGEGGMGVVYMAEQEYPVRRKVALKIIKLGMDTRQVIARFEAERQALALMDHTYIAHVLDAGATETGRPYFVMELVRGVAITDYCDTQNSPTTERLELFIDVCRAVQHAHQKGIIHRDIKPTNVLVTNHDGKPVPKIIDFGVAKATNQPLTEKTLFTEFQQFIGTPEYMSPEQAEMSGLDVDTRTDVYSLGVLLYQMLTGYHPRAGLPAADLVHVVESEDPTRPSSFDFRLGRDLEAVLHAALARDRRRRYPSVHELASDVRLNLAGKSVRAQPPRSWDLHRVLPGREG
jgi:serine/threonine protein kinase